MKVSIYNCKQGTGFSPYLPGSLIEVNIEFFIKVLSKYFTSFCVMFKLILPCYFKNWSMIKMRIFNGFLSGGNFAQQTTKTDHPNTFILI